MMSVDQKCPADDEGFAITMSFHEEAVMDALCAQDERKAEGR